MYRYGLCILFAGILLLGSSQGPGPARAALLKQYTVAAGLYEQARLLPPAISGDPHPPRQSLYNEARKNFLDLLNAATATGYDSLGFFTSLQVAAISYELNEDSMARQFYNQSLSRLKTLAKIHDTVLFNPYIHLGIIYNRERQYDSALHWFRLAENIAGKYPDLARRDRLYEPLGSFYEASGQYTLARGLFESSIREGMDPQSNSAETAALRLKLAKLEIKLNEPFAAASQLKAVLPYHEADVYQHLGALSLREMDYKQAIIYLHQAKSHANDPDRFYLLAESYAAMGQADSANFYLNKALAENQARNGNKKNPLLARLIKFRGDQFSRERRYQEAIDEYQQALIAFVPGFDDAGTDANPSNFTGIHAYTELFNNLAAKGDALEKLYHQEKETDLLNASLSSYRTAWALVEYVQQVYTPDESRNFMGKIIQTLKGRSVNICLVLYELTRKKSYLEEAWLFSQRNRLLGSHAQDPPSRDSITHEGKLQTSITRLLLQTPRIRDSAGWSALLAETKIYATELDNIRKSGSARNATRVTPVTEVQKKLDNSTALLVYNLAGTELLLLVVTASQLDYFKTPVTTDFFSEIAAFRMALQQTPQSGRYNGTVPAMNLYETLILPVYGNFSHIKRLVIVPDAALHGIPFEALQDENKQYLVEKFSVQYQYSHSLPIRSDDRETADHTLAFAPFASTSFTDTSGFTLPGLPASGAGLLQLKGNIYSDSAATKKNFLEKVNTHPIVRLSTYASVKDEDPSKSFITFYPGTADFRLYAEEIGKLNLSSTRLVMLDASETGSEELISGKGLIRFTRAFATAGCPDVMMTLWRTEDKVSAFLTGRVHGYLDDGYTCDRALQHAKLDLINSREIDIRYRNPGYWANIIFIGEYEANHSGNKWRWVALGVVTILLGYFFIKRRSGN